MIDVHPPSASPPRSYAPLQSHIQKVIEAGVASDVDAMLYALRIGGKIYVVLLAGRSMLQGLYLKAYLESYFADAMGFKQHLPGIIDCLYTDISGKTDAYMVLKEPGNNRWRGFNPPLNIDEIYEKAGV
jgi:hypothetical protein